ncbi:MAG: tetratricopeptide repeat protein [Bacteroidia bacterium]
MKPIWIFALTLALFTEIAEAQSPEKLFSDANEAYAAEKFEEAVQLYEAILSQGMESAVLYFNLANAHYQLQHTALSVLNYERALEIDPGFEDARVNLQLANLRVKDNIKPIPGFAVSEKIRNFIHSYSSGQWAWVAIVLLWIAAFLGAGFLYAGTAMLKRITFFGGIAFTVLSIVALFTSLNRNSVERDSGKGIILSPNVYVKNAPSGSTDLLILHEGVKVTLVKQSEGWSKIRIADVNIGTVEGFVENKDLAPI